jgi:hypothetical protein
MSFGFGFPRGNERFLMVSQKETWPTNVSHFQEMPQQVLAQEVPWIQFLQGMGEGILATVLENILAQTGEAKRRQTFLSQKTAPFRESLSASIVRRYSDLLQPAINRLHGGEGRVAVLSEGDEIIGIHYGMSWDQVRRQALSGNVVIVLRDSKFNIIDISGDDFDFTRAKQALKIPRNQKYLLYRILSTARKYSERE